MFLTLFLYTLYLKIYLLWRNPKYSKIDWFDRKKVDIKSLLHSLNVFKDNKPCELLIFAEGGIIKEEKDIGKKVHNGVTFIASKLNVPIIPVFITRRPHFFSKVKVIFGKPYFLDNNLLKNKANLKEESNKLIKKIT